MKNKGALLYTLRPLLYMFISSIITILSLSIAKVIIRFLFFNTTWSIINFLVHSWNRINSSYGTTLVNLLVFVVVTIFVYIGLTYKSNKNLVNVLESVDKMAKGILDEEINVESKDYIGKLASNINKIVKDLRRITIEERRAQKTKTDLITNVSHDLRTPLTSIMGYLGLIEEDKYKDEVQLRYYITIAYQKAKSLNVLINDLFELTKMQNSTLKLDKINIDLVELLGQVIAQFQYQFIKNGMEGRTFFSEDKLIVSADASKLVRAFENLITNGMKYGKDGYYIDVKTELEGDIAVVKFINYGEEILSLDLPYIFERFYRTDKSRNSENGGSGLGLAITKNIIELHGGSVKVTSNSSETIFEVRIPTIK